MCCCDRGARFVPSSLCHCLPALLLLSQRCEYRFSARLLFLMLVFHYRFVLALFHWIGRILFDLDSVCIRWGDCEFGLLKRAHPGVMMVIGVGYGPQAERQSVPWILTSPFLLSLIPLSHPVFRADTDTYAFSCSLLNEEDTAPSSRFNEPA